MTTLAEAVERTAHKLKMASSEPLLDNTEIEEEVNAAVTQYSLDRPRTYVKDLTTQTDPYIAVTDLTGWVTGFSRLLTLEPQAGSVSASYVPAPLTTLDDDVTEYQDGSATYLWLKTITPASGDKLRFSYTVPHTLAATSTIPAHHFDAVCDLAASFCCTRLAAKFSQASDSTIAADSTNYRDGQLRMRQTGNDFYEAYTRKVGISRSGPAGATVIADWDSPTPRGQDRLFHRNRWH